MNLFTGKRLSRIRDILLVVLLVGLVYACDMATLNSSQSGSGSSPTAITGNSNGNGNGGNVVQSNPGGALPLQAAKPQPPPTTYKGCPATGDGGDAQLNVRKNRTDSASWYPVSPASILALKWPKGIEMKPRSSWSAADAAEVAKYEGIPVQIEGYLAGAKQQGPESCNCHSTNDVDNHLWVVDIPNKDRTQSVVAEVTPRVRAMHPGWAFPRIQGVVDSQMKVRISGWLLMDQEHPDQVGKTRGTIWEVHPIIAFDVMSGGQWVSLDTGRASTTTAGGADAAPTVDPNLPPPIVDPYTTSTLPTFTPSRSSGSGGASANPNTNATASGDVSIDTIFYNGVKGSNEPDEYVEIANAGSQPVNMDGWVLQDIYGGQQFTWHGYTLQGNSKIRVYTNEVHADSGGFSFGSKSAIWANKGDAAQLLDASGNVVSTYSYGSRK
jgi:hypothetical protein